MTKLFYLILILTMALVSEDIAPALATNLVINCEGGMEVDPATKGITFKKNVVMIRGDMTIKCDTLFIQYIEENKRRDISTLVGTGQVVCSKSQDHLKIHSDSVHYTKGDELLVFKAPDSKVRVYQLENILTCQQASVNLTTGHMEAAGNIIMDIDLENLEKNKTPSLTP